MARTQTRQAIMDAFLRLLNARPLDRISVKDVVAECGISRNTFYYHYQDIFALLQDLLLTAQQTVLDHENPADSWQESLMQCTRFLQDNRRAVYHVYHSTGREPLLQYLNAVSETVMDTLVRGFARGMAVAEEDIRYITVFYKSAFAGILEEWFAQDLKTDPNRVIRRMGVLFEGSILQALKKAEQ